MNPIVGYFSYHSFENFYAFVSSLVYTARKRMSNKRGFKDWIQYRKESVMQYPILYQCLMNMTLLRVLNKERGVGTMAITP